MGHVWRSIRAAHYTPGRASPISLVVVHCTEGSTAEGAARWFANPRSAGSAQVVVDDEFVYRCVDDRDTAWHARGANSIGLGLEIAGFARWSRDEWLAHMPRLREAARIHAGWNRAYSIPLVESTTRGYHSHAGLPGNDHTDPGAGFPWDVYLDAVREFSGLPVEQGPRPYGRSLRVFTPDGRRFGGWTKAEVPRGWDGPALGPLRWIARQTNPAKLEQGLIVTWRGGTFDEPLKLPRVARTILERTGGTT